MKWMSHFKGGFLFSPKTADWNPLFQSKIIDIREKSGLLFTRNLLCHLLSASNVLKRNEPFLTLPRSLNAADSVPRIPRTRHNSMPAVQERSSDYKGRN
jgi:hypothetical protein